MVEVEELVVEDGPDDDKLNVDAGAVVVGVAAVPKLNGWDVEKVVGEALVVEDAPDDDRLNVNAGAVEGLVATEPVSPNPLNAVVTDDGPPNAWLAEEEEVVDGAELDIIEALVQVNAAAEEVAAEEKAAAAATTVG